MPSKRASFFFLPNLGLTVPTFGQDATLPKAPSIARKTVLEKAAFNKTHQMLNAKMYVVGAKVFFSSAKSGETWPKLATRILSSSFCHRGVALGGGGTVPPTISILAMQSPLRLVCVGQCLWRLPGR